MRLTKKQREAFTEQGYVAGLPVFSKDEMTILRQELDQLAALLTPEESLFTINSWQGHSSWLLDLCMTPQILDYVEDILGADFYLWGTHFFAKRPGSLDTVGWHQDAPYWPLDPHETVTVWLAFTDVDEENGAMQLIPGTHQSGLIKLAPSQSESHNVLGMEVSEKSFDESDAVTICLKAGEISLHDDALIHGSKANTSDRWRIGLTMRFSTTCVKGDTSVWPDFAIHMARGEDKFKHNPYAPAPQQKFGRP